MSALRDQLWYRNIHPEKGKGCFYKTSAEKLALKVAKANVGVNNKLEITKIKV